MKLLPETLDYVRQRARFLERNGGPLCQCGHRRDLHGRLSDTCYACDDERECSCMAFAWPVVQTFPRLEPMPGWSRR